VSLFRYENVTPRAGPYPGQQVNLAIRRDGSIVTGSRVGDAGPGATMVGNGETVDEIMTAYLTAHNYRWTLTQVPEPDLSQACPIDGDLGCGEGGALAWREPGSRAPNGSSRIGGPSCRL
jgi:hypothetical protein